MADLKELTENPLWRDVERFANEEIDRLHRQMENPKCEPWQVAFFQGQIQAWRVLMAQDREARKVETDR